jgi:hypothetical protein
MLLRHSNAGTMRCRDTCGTNAAGACANDEEIIVKISHIQFFPVSPQYGSTLIQLPTGVIALRY